MTALAAMWVTYTVKHFVIIWGCAKESFLYSRIVFWGCLYFQVCYKAFLSWMYNVRWWLHDPCRWCWRMSRCIRSAWLCTVTTSSGRTGWGGPCSGLTNTQGETWRCCVPTYLSSQWASSLWPTTPTAVSVYTVRDSAVCVCVINNINCGVKVWQIDWSTYCEGLGVKIESLLYVHILKIMTI